MAERSRKDVDREKKLHRLLSILRILDIRQQCTPKILAQEFVTKMGTGTFILSCKREKAHAHHEYINICNVMSSVRDACIL